MARHSLAYPSVPASAPTSPAIVRGKAYPPATPQRVVHRGQQRLSSPPYTPVTAHSTPYTPLSLRSFSSSAASSLATPVSATSNRRLSFSYSPEDSLRGKSKKGAADTTNNWRTRANENGIRVSAGEESQYADDEADDCSELDASRYLNMDKSLLPAPFLSAQRRARALTHIQPQVCAPLQQISDPSQLSTPARASHSQPQPFTFSPAFLNTPPPKPSILNKYRLRGTVTDPAHTRRRPAFEQASELFDINEDEYIPYPPAFSSTPPVAAHFFSQTLPLNLNDPFDLSSVSDDIYYDAQSLCVYDDEPEPPSNAPFCSVCGTSSGSLAVLEPCTHPLCSACLTSALNIVGEKDMECAVCKAKVDDFKIKKPTANCAASFNTQTRSTTNHGNNGDAYSHPFGLMPSVIDDGFQDFIDRAQGASTPIASAHSLPKSKSADSSVLRIDNVPWDITPPVIAAWLRHPVERVHVLLDRKGKTQSHAYAEMVSPDAAKAALRTSQNSVLGKGKRARGVTVTRSNQEELMRALFPSWKGTFDGARPSLANLDNEHVIATLQHGLISDSELKALMHLVRSPDSHFLKVPALPFHSIISILSKFPADDDSRLFWSLSVRDTLYELTYTAVQVLMTRIEDNPFSEWTSLLTQLVRAAMDCQAFTAEQMSKLSDILEAALPPSTSFSTGMRTTRSPDFEKTTTAPSKTNIDHNVGNVENINPYRDLAKEFGVEAHLVEALALRLSRIS